LATRVIDAMALIQRLSGLIEPRDWPWLVVYLLLAVVAGCAEMAGIGMIVGFVMTIGNVEAALAGGAFTHVLGALAGDMRDGRSLAIGSGAIALFILVKNLYLTWLSFICHRYIARRQSALARALIHGLHAWILRPSPVPQQRRDAAQHQRGSDQTLHELRPARA
jgi:hypothetical protein